jgi:hypothetical protein
MDAGQLEKLEVNLWPAANNLLATYDNKECKEKAEHLFAMFLGFAKNHIKWVT